MAKTNINFNNKTYQVDESTLSAATSALRTHLSTTMNGSGATINFGGTTYNVDSAKLTALTNDFITYLGTVAGSGHKVIVNGREYGVDASKVAGAVSELETVLGNLNNGGSNPPSSDKLTKNEYGFYYNVPYVYKTGDIIQYIYMFYNDGTCPNFVYEEDVSATLSQAHFDYTYDEATNSLYFPQFGAALAISDDGNALTFGDMSLIADPTMAVSHGIYYEDVYESQDGNKTITCHEDGSITLTSNTISETIVENQWIDEYYGYINGSDHLKSTIDGEFICVIGDNRQITLYSRVK